MDKAIYLTTNMFRVYLVLKFFRMYLGKCKVNKKGELTAYIIYYLVNSITYMTMRIPLCTLAVNIVSLLVLSYIYEGGLKQKILCIVIQYSVMMCAEVISVYLVSSVPPIVDAHNPIYSAAEYVIANLSAYPCVLIIEKIKKKDYYQTPALYWVMAVFIPAVSIFIALILCVAHPKEQMLAVIGTMGLLLVDFTAFELYEKVMQYMQDGVIKVQIQMQNKMYAQQMQIYQKSIEQMKYMRHDWKNQLSVIGKMAIDSNDMTIYEYVCNLQKRICVENEYSNTGNKAFDAAINFKCSEAAKKGIQLSLNINIDSIEEIEEVDLTTIIGNLMDNAIDACMNVSDKNMPLHIGIEARSNYGCLVLKITNTYDKCGIRKDRFNRIITTKKDTQHHGIGFEHVYSVVKKYNGEIQIMEDEEFCVKIILCEK